MANFLPLLEDNSSLLLESLGAVLLEESFPSGSIIRFNSAELLGLRHTCNFFGQAYNYSNTHVLSIKGRATGSYDSIRGVWSGMVDLINFTTGNASKIIINSVEVGTGRVLSFDFVTNTDVGHKEYTATIEIPRHAGSGVFSNYGYLPATGGYFGHKGEKVTNYFTSSTGKHIKSFSFSEDYEIISSGKFSCTKNIDFSLSNGMTEEFGVLPNTYAKNLMTAAKGSFGDCNVVTTFYPDFYKNGSGISYTTQSYDIINYQYSFSERFDFQTGRPYIWSYNHSFELNDAIVSVSENGTITSSQSELNTYTPSNKIAAAESAWIEIETGIYGRVSGIYDGYTGFIGYTGSCILINQPETSSVSKNTFAGTIDYSRSYSNNPYIYSGYQYSYSDEISLDEEGYISVSENGQLKAYRNIRPQGFGLVYTGYLANTGAIYSRITGFYHSSSGFLRDCFVTGILNLQTSSEVYKEYDAEVEYSISYTDNPSYSGNSLFYNIKSSTSDSTPLHMVSYFPVTYNSVIAQKANQSTRGVFRNSIALVGRENTVLNDFVTGALGIIQKPSGSDIYVTDYSYSYEPLTKSFSMDLSYNYTRYRQPDNYLI